MAVTLNRECTIFSRAAASPLAPLSRQDFMVDEVLAGEGQGVSKPAT
jgi:hypothetical protein